MSDPRNQATTSTATKSDSQPPQDTKAEPILDYQINTANAFAILSTLFAGVQAQLLSGIPTDSDFSRALIGTLQFFSYGGLVINISAALSAIFFISLANLERDAAGRVKASRDKEVNKGSVNISRGDEVNKGLNQLRRFFLTLTFLGTYFILLQICLLTWTAKNRARGMFGVVMGVIWVSFIPLTVYTKAVYHQKRNQ